jgi:hypothetical protein
MPASSGSVRNSHATKPMGVSSPRSQMIGVGRLSAPETGRSEVEAVPLLLRGIDHASFNLSQRRERFTGNNFDRKPPALLLVSNCFPKWFGPER